MIALAGVMVFLFLLASLLGRFELSWNGLWVLVRGIAVIGLCVVLFRFFLTRAR